MPKPRHPAKAIQRSKFQIGSRLAHRQDVAARRLYFVDGVRRVDARVLSQENDGCLIHGLFASAAAGSVVSDDCVAAYGNIEVRRYLILTAGKCKSESITAGGPAKVF
ncbi:MAG: hypothetical protein ABI693_27660 [Bryobacteraceae bacterium]